MNRFVTKIKSYFIKKQEPDNVKNYRAIVKQMLEIYKRKSEDYGNTSSDMHKEWGEAYYLIMVEQKIKRLIELYRKESPKNESIEDSWLDLANYCVLRLMEEKQ